MAGYSADTYGPSSDFALVRYTPSGNLDVDFGTEGLVITSFGPDLAAWAKALAIQADGKLVVAGMVGRDFALARYLGVRTPPSELLAAIILETQELVSSGDLNNGNGNALLVKLQAAIQQMDRDNHGAATNQMQAFINQVEGFIGAGVLTPEEGQPLIDAALAAVGGLAKREGGQLATTELPISFSLSQNYPNPFNPTTTIAYSLPEAGTVTVTVYDLLGREVQTLADGFQTAGAYVITWDGHTSAGDAAASGVYFYRLVSNSQVESRKMVLMK